MPGAMRKIMIAGRLAEVPEENYEALVKHLDASGVEFGPPPDANIDEGQRQVPGGPPARGNSTPFVEPNPNMQGEYREPPSTLEQLVNGAQDALSGFTHGATLHNDANLWDVVDRKYGDRVREANALGQNRSPNVYGTAEMIGGVVPSIAMGAAGLVGRGANLAQQLVSNVGAQGLQGIAGGYARGYGDSSPDAAPGERGRQAVDEAEREGILSALVSGGASLFGQAAGAAKDVWAKAGDKARAAAVGFGGQDLQKLAQSKGLDFVEGNVGRLPEELGVTNRFIPQSASTYAKRLGARADMADDQITQATRDAAAQGVQGPGFIDKPSIVGQVQQAQNAALRSPYGDRAARAGAMGDVASGINQQPISTPEDLLILKRQLDSVAYPNSLQGSSESLMGQAHKVGADATRGQLRDAMSYALPETNQAFTQGNIDLGHAATLSDVARDAAAQRYSGGGVMGNLGAAAIGAAAGAPFGQGLAGASIGLARPAYAAAQNYGADFGANIARGLEGASGGASRFGNAMGNSLAGSMGASLSPSEQRTQLNDSMRGYLGGQAIEMVLDRNPEALGKYAPQLMQARKDGTLSGVLLKLYQSDPEFRSNVYPTIQQLTRAE